MNPSNWQSKPPSAPQRCLPPAPTRRKNSAAKSPAPAEPRRPPSPTSIKTTPASSSFTPSPPPPSAARNWGSKVSGKRGWIRTLFLTIALTTIGCSARLIPPFQVADPVPVFVADYGRHSSILLPDQNGKLLEFAWGDYEWFAVNHNSAGDACAALFWSHGSTMGIRWLETAPQRADLLAVVGCEHLLAFSASKQRAAALR